MFFTFHDFSLNRESFLTKYLIHGPVDQHVDQHVD